MAFRIRKSFKVAPGIRLNVSKSGLSTSIGGKGTTVNLSKRGTKVTSSIPGTGISTSKLYGSSKAPNTSHSAPTASPGFGSYLLTLLIIAGVLWAIFHK
ncbi:MULTISPECIES: DUF4236 domain-containing protein [Pseudomonas]|uniref:DUF4236 domain-containing protein n=1 Tax=Pseudomonas TaxID=286 RepID=UPI0009B828B0|nr:MULTISPECIES: DUF4236 domain-containing protein [Pseudomonas]KAB0532823.1 DUF4236 domain-containing protein [Pseudomonas chlororaphis subsp. aureofaciens]TSD25989.1 DUF4236 domain-containing protein [Pseudomonas sp. ATCC 13985]WDG57811.1 DUF4236 domain-containing protein [Pseudomonas chlororaphis]WDG64024.1 DUF4236 domain-containing protein [Pseudomonas chlororaphis]